MKTLRSLFLFPILVSLGILAAPGQRSNAQESDTTKKRNIVFFVTDDLSPTLGCYGNKVIKTPNIDALAADATTFDLAFATTASCSASRSVILSGLHNHANGQYGHQHHYHKFGSYPNVRSLPVLLAEQGYRTAQVGKYHVAPEEVYHFEHYFKGNGRNAVQMTNACEEFLKAKDEKPFFLYIATSDPHRGGGVDKTSPHKPDLFGNRPKKGSHQGIREVFYDPREVIVPPFLPDTDVCRAELAQYYQSVSRIDTGIGRLIEVLKEAEQWDNTLFVFTADHGMAFPGGKTTTYEPGLRIPFIVRDPSVPKKKRGIRSKAMVSLVDVTPSLLDYAGGLDREKNAPKIPFKGNASRGTFQNRGPIREKFHGRSFIPIIPEPDAQGWDEIGASHTFHEIQMYYPMRVVRDRRYKLIWNIAYQLPYPFASDLWASPTWQKQWKEGKDAMYGPRTVGQYVQRAQFELFDLEKDPNESTNLADNPQYATLLESYKEKLKAMQKRTEDPWIMKWNYE